MLENRILEVFVFKQNAAQDRKKLSPTGLSPKRALAAFASAGIGLQHTRSRSRLARARFGDNGDIRGFGIGSKQLDYVNGAEMKPIALIYCKGMNGGYGFFKVMLSRVDPSEVII